MGEWSHPRTRLEGTMKDAEDKGILSAHYRGEIQALGKNLMEHPENAGPISS